MDVYTEFGCKDVLGRMDVHKDVYTDVYTDVRMESRNALDGLKSKISPLRFRCTERQVCSSNISRVSGGQGEMIWICIQGSSSEFPIEDRPTRRPPAHLAAPGLQQCKGREDFHPRTRNGVYGPKHPPYKTFVDVPFLHLCLFRFSLSVFRFFNIVFSVFPDVSPDVFPNVFPHEFTRIHSNSLVIHG